MELFTVFFLPPVNGYNEINILIRPEKKEVRGRKTMQTRPLGKADLHLTTIGLGTWAIGGPWDFGWGPQEDTESIATIQQALDLGINWIDTAPAYGLGHAEEIVGRAIKGRRDRVIIATKCGLVWDDPKSRTVTNRLKAASIRKEAEDSLRRLRIEVIDLYQIHWPEPQEDIEEAWITIANLIAQGKVRYGGVSNFSVSQIKRVQALHQVASLQPPYSLLDRAVEVELLPYCKENGIGVVAYGPLAYGLLTGKYTRARIEALPKDDWRHRGARFQEPELSANLALIDKLRPIAERHGRSLGQLAIAWVLRHSEVTSAIVGARRPSQLMENAQATDWVLPDEDLQAIDDLLAERDTTLAGYRPTGAS
jgi:aryl-alcohol dehydrogenase-like predicted oxidoreductase